MKDLIFISNGHGEDDIACKVIDQIRAEAQTGAAPVIEAWPMVGEGAAYRKRNIPVVGAFNLLPSCGFGTLGLKMFLRDLCAGWIQTHLRQLTAARELREGYRLAVVVGDVVPIVAALIGRTRFLMIGCAKSSYYNAIHGYTPMEKRLLRKHCLCVFPRDELTVRELNRARVPNRYVGNPMMDGLEGSGEPLGFPAEATVIAVLPGSRFDVGENLLDLLEAAHAITENFGSRGDLRFAVALAPKTEVAPLRKLLEEDARVASWSFEETDAGRTAPGEVLRLKEASGAGVVFFKGRFADVLRASMISIGMAGTAHEQSIGLGVPVINVPSSGVQDENYVKMKMEFFGESAVAAPRLPGAIAGAALELIDDPDRRAQMATAGRERMGDPGASRAIAEKVLEALRDPPARIA